MREGLFETINKSKRVQSGKERFRALGLFVESFFKFFCMLILGSTITKFMKSMRIQQMNPYNYLISFLILCAPLVITFLLLLWGKLEEEEDNAKPSQKQSGVNTLQNKANPNSQNPNNRQMNNYGAPSR